MDQPNTIGNTNASTETSDLVRPGSYQNTRSETGSSVASGRGPLGNPPAEVESWPRNRVK